MSRPNQPENPNHKPEDQETNKDINALFSSFRVDQLPYRTFTRHRTPKAWESIELITPSPILHGRAQIGVYSPAGGTGKSTIVASLGAVLWQMGKRILLVDASPWPTLAYHYGATAIRAGLRSFYAPHEKELPVRILTPEGRTSVTTLDINNLAFNSALDYVLFDLGGLSDQELAGYLEQCQTLLVPLCPNASAVRQTETISALLSGLSTPPAKVIYFINQMEEATLAKDISANLTHTLGDLLFPTFIERQSEVQEAFAEGIPLPFYAPKAQATLACSELTKQLDVPKLASTSRAQQRWSER